MFLQYNISMANADDSYIGELMQTSKITSSGPLKSLKGRKK